jgi:hypothetical protein
MEPEPNWYYTRLQIGTDQYIGVRLPFVIKHSYVTNQNWAAKAIQKKWNGSRYKATKKLNTDFWRPTQN